MSDIVERLRGACLDRDNFPRMDSERWLPIGLAKEAAAEVERLRSLSQNNAHSWDTIVRERDGLRAEVERLKEELHSALVYGLAPNSQAAEIERLTKDRNDWYMRCLKAEAELERLTAALRPFADAADTLSNFPDDTRLDLAPITLGQLRHARKALERK